MSLVFVERSRKNARSHCCTEGRNTTSSHLIRCLGTLLLAVDVCPALHAPYHMLVYCALSRTSLLFEVSMSRHIATSMAGCSLSLVLPAGTVVATKLCTNVFHCFSARGDADLGSGALNFSKPNCTM